MMLARGARIRLFQGTVKAPCWGFQFRRVLGRRASRRRAGPRLRVFATPSVSAALRVACFARISLSALDEMRAWGYAEDEEAFTNILIFTDGSGTMTNSWPPSSQPRDAGWAIAVLGRSSSGRLRRARPTEETRKLTALFCSLASSCFATTRLHSDTFSDSEYATGVVEGWTRAQRATGLVRRAGTCFSKHAGCTEFSSTRQSPHRGRCQRSRRRLGEHPARGSRQPRRTIRFAVLGGDRQSPDPMVRLSSPVDTARQPATSLVIATANVLTFYLQEEAQGETWAPSARTHGSCETDTRGGKTTLLSVRAAPCGSPQQRQGALAGRSSGPVPASATTHGRSFPSATRPDLWSRAKSEVSLLIFVSYVRRRRTPSPGWRMVGQHSSDPPQGVRADSGQNRHDRCQWEIGRGSHPFAGELLPARLRRQWPLPPRFHARLGHGGPGLF